MNGHARAAFRKSNRYRSPDSPGGARYQNCFALKAHIELSHVAEAIAPAPTKSEEKSA
jgi:hypothetical protein